MELYRSMKDLHYVGEAGNGIDAPNPHFPDLTFNLFRAPSIIWQFLWNYFFGPYLLWKIRMIRDIYHWRLQTMLAVVAGYVSSKSIACIRTNEDSLLGTPMWLASVYTDSFRVTNKYWVPAMW